MSVADLLAPPSALRAWFDAAGRARPAPTPAARAVGREAAGVDEQDRSEVRAALDGDGPAYGRIVARHQQAVARQLSRFARDAGTREQLVQDTFVEAWQSLAGWSGRSPLGAWLRTIATRVGYRHWREAARGRDLRDADDPRLAEALARAAGPSPEPAPREAAELLHALLARLAPRDRLVLTLLYWDGCSIEEAAGLIGWSRTMVKVQAFRARRRLEKLLPAGLRPDGLRSGRTGPEDRA